MSPIGSKTATPPTPAASAADPTRQSAAGLARLIASGDLSSREVLEAHIARIASVNPVLNAVTADRFAAARLEADAADAARKAGDALGPLHGIPFTVKDCLDLKGLPSTFGLPSRSSHRAEKDVAYVRRLREAGAIPIAKTNVAQLLLYYESDNPLFGRTRNPWNPERSPGGSSGGEAALIAAGGSPLGLGTDIGGSLRVPAAFCGIASLKPTAGRLPDPGRFSFPVGQSAIASQVGVMARHVEDVALGSEILAGGWNALEEPPRPWSDFRSVDVADLRVAYYVDDGTFAPAPAIRRAVEEAAESLRLRGARVTAWRPPAILEGLELLGSIFFADRTALLRATLGHDRRAPQLAPLLAVSRFPGPVLRALEALLRSVGQEGPARSFRFFGRSDAAHYWKLAEARLDFQDRFRSALDSASGGPFDVILCPPCALPAFTHGASKDLIMAGGYSALYNLLGYPAGVVPVTRVRPDEQAGRKPSRDLIEKAARKVEEGSEGLPVGVQVVARPWREHMALSAMKVIEEEAEKRPEFPSRPQ